MFPRDIQFTFLLFLIFLWHFLVPVKPELYSLSAAARDVREQLDLDFRLPDGVYEGELRIFGRWGRRSLKEIRLFQKKGDRLILVRSETRELELRVLYKNRGEEVHVYDDSIGKLFVKKGKDRFVSFAGSGFSFMDLAGRSYMDAYDIEKTIQGREKGLELHILKSIADELPVSLHVATRDDRPIRLDYYNNDKTLLKSMKLEYDGMLVYKVSGVPTEITPVRYRMTHVQQDEISTFELYTLENRFEINDYRFDPDLFYR